MRSHVEFLMAVTIGVMVHWALTTVPISLGNMMVVIHPLPLVVYMLATLTTCGCLLTIALIPEEM